MKQKETVCHVAFVKLFEPQKTLFLATEKDTLLDFDTEINHKRIHSWKESLTVYGFILVFREILRAHARPRIWDRVNIFIVEGFNKKGSGRCDLWGREGGEDQNQIESKTWIETDGISLDCPASGVFRAFYSLCLMINDCIIGWEKLYNLGTR